MNWYSHSAEYYGMWSIIYSLDTCSWHQSYHFIRYMWPRSRRGVNEAVFVTRIATGWTNIDVPWNQMSLFVIARTLTGKFHHTFHVNSVIYVDRWMRRYTGSLSVQVITCRLFFGKPHPIMTLLSIPFKITQNLVYDTLFHEKKKAYSKMSSAEYRRSHVSI